jgi:hypothetical protein
MDGFLMLFFIVFFGIFGLGIFVVIKSIYGSVKEKQYNDSQPILTKDVKISGKRSSVSGGSGESSVSTSYYATFEFLENKERLEFSIPSKDYGLIAEDDLGKLTYQGRRYHQFQRNL